MAIALDTTVLKMNDGFVSGGTAVTWSHTVTGTNPVLIVEAGIWQDAPGTGSITAASYNGTAMTLGVAVTSTGMRSEIWYLLNAPNGANTVSITITGASDGRRFASTSFTGVAAIGATTTSATATGSPSASVTVASIGDLVIDNVARFSTTALTVGGGQTQLYNDVTTPNGNTWVTTLGAGSYKIATASGSNTMSWTGASNNDTAQVVATFTAATAVTPNTGQFFAFF